MASYDALVIGGGHNGLVAAAYLGRAGRKVCVLERRPVLGGCASTEELWPGFRASPAAYVISLFLPEIVRELRLDRHGLRILPRNPSSFTPLRDGRSLVLGHDDAGNRRQVGQFSLKDAETLPRYEAMLARIAAGLEPLVAAPAPRLPPRLRDLRGWLRVWRAARRLGNDLRTAIELFTAPAARVLDRYFESDVLKATLATDAIIGAFVSPSTPGSAAVLLHHVMGRAGGKRGVWGYVRGGMGGLADALECACRAAGVEIRRETEVVAIRSHFGEARGVTLRDGTAIDARVVLSNLDAQQTLLRLLDPSQLPDDYRQQVRHVDYSSASAKINLALDGLPDFNTGAMDRTVALRGTTHISPSIEYIERAYRDARDGRCSEHPVLELTIPSLVDDSLAPPGKHVASIFVQYAPYHLAGTDWDAQRESFADRCLDLLSTYAPNIKGLVLHRQVLAPPDLERIYGLTGGNIMQGAMGLDQLGPMRLDYETPVRGLFLCGAATHPGGGVIGACGRNAAQAVLASL